MKREIIASLSGFLLLAGCAQTETTAYSGITQQPQTAPYDARPLLNPKQDYLGVAYEGAGRRMEPLKTFGKAVGKQPNLVSIYADFDDDYPVKKVENLWKAGVLPLIVWEPFKSTLQDIGQGTRDRHVTEFAEATRELNIPVALNFAHEMNGHWYPWGTKRNTPEDYLAAYRRIHDLFAEAGATNVIWVWSPNVLINNNMRLAPYWPGDHYADWVGPIGYFEWSNDSRSFAELFGPPIKAMRRFTGKPVLLSETGAPPGVNKPRHITDLYRTVAARKDIIGVIWFNIKKERDWRINSDPASLNAFRKAVSGPRYGFDPRTVK